MRGVFLKGLAVLVILAVAESRNGVFSRCPSKCQCYKRAVKCIKLGMNKVPTTSLSTIFLDLRFNNIEQLPSGVFKNSSELSTILLNNNHLGFIEDGSFEGLKKIQHLYLHYNKIRFIHPNAFQGLLKLERLYLHHNQLEEIYPVTFSNLPSLKRLNLFHNQLKHLPENAFHNLPSLERLRLDHNALVCNCEMLWLTEMFTNNSLDGSAYCKYPAEMHGKSLKETNAEDLHCVTSLIKEGPQDLKISLGQDAIFTCKVYDPSATIFWMRDDEEVVPDRNKYVVLDNGTLLIQNADENDGGYYECVAKNVDKEEKSAPAKMIVEMPEKSSNKASGAPTFIEVPSNVLVSASDTDVTLKCQAAGDPKPVIKWAKNGIRLPPSNKYVYLEEGSLVVRFIDVGDDGSYQCEALNKNGRIHAQADIIMKAPPIFTVQPENINPQVGNNIKLECVASGTPTPELTWFKNDLEVLPNDADGRIQLSEDRTLLEINNIQESDTSTYVCEAWNDVGMREVSAFVNVQSTSYKPAKLIYKPTNIEVLAGSTIELPCRATGDPKPGITWQKDGSSMQRTGRFKVSLNGNLYIYKVGPEDQGRYECTALNDYGRDSAAGYVTVTVKKLTDPVGIGIGDQYVKVAFAEATEEVDRAINRTLENVINKKGTHNPAELFRIIRYPDAPARELARASEVYERTLTNIRKYVENGNLTLNPTADFNYKELLSAEHLDLIARLSGCTSHRLMRNCSNMCFHSKYRSIDGTCNNLQHPTWGASLTEFRRVLKPIYEDGLAKPVGWDKQKKYYGYPKPISRLVSTSLIATKKITSDPEITHMVMQWGQFLDHDLDHSLPSVTSESWDGIDCKKSCDYAAPCYPMDVPPNDPRVTNRRCIDFIRTSSICGSGMTSVFFDAIQPREQINQLTSYIDASQVYGFSEELASNLRDHNSNWGRLREGPVFPGRKPLLPYAENQGIDCRRNLTESTLNCFVAGDIRANEQVGLVAMHTLWLREHNRIAKELKTFNPHWDTDRLYHEARKIVGATMQHVTYKHWLPIVLGGTHTLGEYKDYDPNLNPSISNVFATAALRFGHTLINPILHRLDADFKPIREGHLPLSKAFFSPWRVVEEGGVDPLIRGMFTVAAKIKKPDENLNTELTETLFQAAHAVALDLAAMNIHRGRDHALPGYLDYRKFCNMDPVHSFDDLKYEISDANVRRKLQKLYGHPGNIDVFVGGILEDQIDGGKVGPLFQCLLVEQFKRLRDGDRFWYENPSVFKPEQLAQIKQFTLARMICDNGDNITRITNDVFKLPEIQGGYVNCHEVPKMDLRVWYECFTDCKYFERGDSGCQVDFREYEEYIRRQNKINRIRRDATPSILAANETVQVDDIAMLKSRMTVLENDIDELKSNLKKYDKVVRKLKRNTGT